MDRFITPISFVAKLAKFANRDEEEYPPGETPPKEERAKTLETAGYPEVFLVPHLCEYAIGATSAHGLESYAKRYRLPKARQYAKDVLRLFEQARKTANGDVA